MLSGPWGHDRTWERSVVEQIRRGGAAPGVISPYDAVPQAYYEADVNASGHGWEYAEARSKDAIRSGAVYLNDEANARRALQRKLFREGVREAQAKAAARTKKYLEEKHALAAEKAKEQRRWEAGRAAREARVREEREAWNLETRRMIDENRILASKWICTKCNGKSVIVRKNDGYQITCLSCEKTAFGSHASLIGVLNQ